MKTMTPFQQAQLHAQSGQFTQMLSTCEEIASANASNPNVLLDLGALLSDFGFVTYAKTCFERICVLSPNDLRPVINLANLAQNVGNHTESQRLYSFLLTHLPNNPMVRRNALVNLEYDASVSDEQRLSMAKAWAGEPKPRPIMSKSLQRIGYVSADFCQHTVGLFVKDVFKAHTIEVYTYSAGQVKDWVTESIQATTHFRDVCALDDLALAQCIRDDQIDLLVDLSGHTAGSRLTVFTHRPAPVQISWLGYFATTGLSCMDAVFLDPWHAPLEAQAQFVEPIVRLPTGRFCYQPVPFAPAQVDSLPALKRGYITFGCFNNTAKFNAAVFDVWARILGTVPHSRLVLKWRTFNDEHFAQSIRNEFASRGIEPTRLELRRPSFHVELLKEYGDIDIALDPFPFTGGLTSCEALWMGVPVVTLPQSRVVSRQTFAFLSAIGLPELAAKDSENYVRIAAQLAQDTEHLSELRQGMRTRMLNSPLMDLPEFTRQFEQHLFDLFESVKKVAR